MDGRWILDVITLEDARDPSANLKVTHRFAELSELGFSFKYGPFDGVLGLAPRSSSLHSILHYQAMAKKKEYTVCYYRDGGYLTFGSPTSYVLTGGRRYRYYEHIDPAPWTGSTEVPNFR